MYCYQCSKGGKITKVLDGDSKCRYNHFAHTLSLDEDIELNEKIAELKARKQNDESNYIREFIANERR